MSKFLLLSLASLVFASPVVAETNAAGTKGAVNPSPTPTAVPQREQRFCVVSQITGSRIAHKECKTRSEWLAEGFDPLAK